MHHRQHGAGRPWRRRRGGDGGDGGDGGGGGDGGDGGGGRGGGADAQITKPTAVVGKLLHAIVSPAAITTLLGPLVP